MKKVNINDIRIDGGTQGRMVIDQTTVAKYVENMKEGDEFPRMFTVFDGTTHWLVDGFHRYHAMKIIGVKTVEIDYKPGTLEEAQVMSFGMNARHGLPRTNEDKRKVVQAAMEHPLLKDKSDYEIAKACCVSRSFVGSIRNPEVKKQQQQTKEKHVQKKAEEVKKRSQTTLSGSEKAPKEEKVDDKTPSDQELLADKLRVEADTNALYKILSSDDKLSDAWDEIKRLNHEVSVLESRMAGIMNERNELIKEVKKLQRQLDKARNQK